MVRLIGSILCALVVFFAVPVFAQSSGPYAYEVETLNSGLGEPASSVNRETPQAALETFYALAAEEDWQSAAHLLELSFLSPQQQAELGPELAEQLFLVLERGLIVDWAGIPDRSDAVDTVSSSDAPMAGEPRRNLRLTLVSLPERPVTIRLARLNPQSSDPVWVFPRQTVENIPDLYEFYAPSDFEQKFPPVLMEQAFWTLTWWEVIALPVFLLISFGLAAITWWAVGRLHTMTSEVHYAGPLINAIQSPAALLVFAGSFALMRRNAFTLSAAVNAVISPIVTAAVVLAIAALFVRVLDAIIERVTDSRNVDVTTPDAEADRAHYTSLSAVRRFVLVLLLVIGIAFVLVQTNLSQTLGFSLLASAGAIGIVLAFAAREVLGNVMASLQLGLADSVRIGDAVIWEGQWAYVERIGFTHVRLRTWDDRRLMAPVNQFVSETFENWTKTNPELTKYVMLTLDHRADIETLREIFQPWVDGHDELIDPENEAKVQVVGHSHTGMDVRFLFRASDPNTAWDLHCQLREYLLSEISKLDEAAEDGPVFLPREREVQTQDQRNAA